ncbi:retrovirus-related Pol polyprotein from transposon TNT 1-94 [Senna tora]|uniref:Retrovirus-related Pol polyprotein from transposon TNT 1-94 n=1 Tax=Senna tora TaxID=362788 RepID=A0A834X7Z5_9FABA|nr:retrovirus-related Pol polyprotein from transposon TNT 1-94 [Senna tora]
MWNHLKERFSITDGPRIQQLQSNLANCKQKGMTIVDYFGQLEQLWDKLSNYDPVPTCKCSDCTCNITSTLEKKREDERVHTFLLGLDDNLYGTVPSTVLAQDPPPGVNKVYSILVQEERVKTMARAKDDQVEVMALATRTRHDSRDKNMVCSHCKKIGHDSANCFALVGYPEWWGDRPRGDGKGSGRGRGQSNNGGRGRGMMRANAAQTTTSSSVNLNVLVYVDDLIISGNHPNTIQMFKAYLGRCFHMKDLGFLKYFLGVEVARGPSGFFLYQRKCALDIVTETGLLGFRPASIPLEQNHRLALSTSALLDDPEKYRQQVGRLIYLCFTRPDLSYNVHVLSQFMTAPQDEH